MNSVYEETDGYWYFDDEDGIPQGPFEDKEQALQAYQRWAQTQ